MPLKAKVLSRQAAPRLLMSTQAAHELFKPVEGDEPEDVLFNSLYGLRSIELNRPMKLNALNGSMIRKIGPRLIEWSQSDMANVIVIKGTGEKAFCAGGDVAQLARWNQRGPKGKKLSMDYFALEYQLDHMIATLNKPYVAFMDGITMGGGVGLSVHAPFRIATERTVFAMPETTIGFFPDVGASFFLPKMPGATGTFLALTSARLTGANVFYAGLATHYLHSSSLPALESRLAELRFNDYDEMPHRLSVVNATIEEYCTGLPHDEPILMGGELRKAIDRCFRHNSVEDIISALETEEGPAKAWAQGVLDMLHQRSPTSVHVALRQMRIGRKWTIAETFRREHQIAAKFMAHRDFNEGVTAVLIDKRAPKWKPAALEDILPDSNISEPFIRVDDYPPPLQLVNDTDYAQYPYGKLGLPTEREVEDQVSRGNMTRKQVLDHFLQDRSFKQGVREVVKEILDRKTAASPLDNTASWLYE
ncbi:ClpP/crotonase-like domain-containing protein [Lasiosphaeria miniovina]|uniref:3-hydroxyisobutyryl-CoA hydrolase n=1 Tax=Lasiosphaeria miniovina TaxID=1954250 RepID=A0AA40E430_9PEZI|nr:ClpP/crotonase-like domain-containing protein [Lasiosphaeria miniovina]KAK0727309.1 ClpP/crotonase-like domain-containing protein [Lasiosphaeria miniovina]